MKETDARMIEAAILLAVEAHRGQRRGGNEPRILHAMRVMCSAFDDVSTAEDAEALAALILHDVVEDTDYGLSDLQKVFPRTVCDLVDALTRRDGEGYEAYINRLLKTPGAARLKLFDLQDNRGRLHLLKDTAAAKQLFAKYYSAERQIREAAGWE